MISIDEQIKIISKGAEEIIEINELKEKLKKAQSEGKKLTVKLGLDPTAPDIHLGHAVVLRKIKQMQDLGHKAIILIGDFTGMIGDPTGKSKTRKQLSREEVLTNARTYEEQIFKILDKDKTELRFNSEWLSKLVFKDVIELCAKYTVARMLEREDFKNRFAQHESIGIHEFFYPLMQAYDSIAINADIELGGNDQRFNILMGRTLQKDYGQESQIAIFMPLLEGTDGIEKMSKSLGNYIGINESANDIYVKVMQVSDNLIIKYFELATDIHPDEIEKIKKELQDSRTNPRDVKMRLAKEITTLYHDEEKANLAEEHFKTVFQKKDIPDDIQEFEVKADEITRGETDIIKILTAARLVPSNNEARRMFLQGAVKVNGQKVIDYKVLNINDGDVVQVGKSKFVRISVKR